MKIEASRVTELIDTLEAVTLELERRTGPKQDIITDAKDVVVRGQQLLRELGVSQGCYLRQEKTS